MAAPNSVVEASCPAQQWVIRNLSALEEKLQLVVDGLTWYVSLTPSKDHKIPGIYLNCVTERFLPVKVHFAVTIVDQQKPHPQQYWSDRSAFHEYDRIFTAEDGGWGWETPVTRDPIPPGLMLDDTMVLKTRVRVLEKPGSVDEPLIDESQGFLARACKRMYTGKTALEPDVILKLGDDMLPAHRCLLAESSDFYRTMFQSGMSESGSNVVEIQEVAAEDMKVILKFIYGELDAIPRDRLQSLVLATDRLQMRQLMNRCLTQLKLRLTLDNFAEAVVLADKVNSQGLHDACVEFALRKENRSAVGKLEALKCIMADVPDLVFKLLGDILEQSLPKDAG